MKYQLTLAIAACLLANDALAQTAPPPADKANKPVTQTQAPENQATNPEQQVTGPLKAPTPSPNQPQAAAPAVPAKSAKWDVNAPPGMTTRELDLLRLHQLEGGEP